jgi:hypothetical protein
VPEAKHLVPALGDGNHVSIHNEHSVENMIPASVDITEIGHETNMLEV